MLTEEEYYERFKNYDKDRLFEIISNRVGYQEKALKATLKVIEDKGLENDLSALLNPLKIGEERSITDEHNFIKQKSEYYSKAVQFKNENNYINIRTPEIIKFEAALNKNGVDYFSEDKNIDAFMALYPTHRYYFLSKDLEKIDGIMIKLGMTDPQQDIKPFFKFEMKTTVITIFIVIAIAVIIAFISR